MKTTKLNQVLLATFCLLLTVVSCKQRDDYPDFSKVEPPKVEEDIIPEDKNILPLTQQIMKNSAFVKQFLIDSSVNIATGVAYIHLRFINNLDQKVSLHLVELDKSKANISMVSLSPYDDYLYSVQQLSEMTMMNQETVSDQLVASIVGGVHSAGNPTAAFAKKGRLTKTNTSAVLPYIGVKKGSSAIEVLNSPNATTYPVPAIVFNDYFSLVGGSSWLIYNNVEITAISTAAARSGIGMTADKQKIYLLSVDGVNAFSAGVSTDNFIQLFKALACSTAFYTNGGTFNALAIRENNKFTMKNKPVGAIEPAIGNGIGFVIKK